MWKLLLPPNVQWILGPKSGLLPSHTVIVITRIQRSNSLVWSMYPCSTVLLHQLFRQGEYAERSRLRCNKSEQLHIAHVMSTLACSSSSGGSTGLSWRQGWPVGISLCLMLCSVYWRYYCPYAAVQCTLKGSNMLCARSTTPVSWVRMKDKYPLPTLAA